jgi:hypothetical protein
VAAAVVVVAVAQEALVEALVELFTTVAFLFRLQLSR